MIQELAWHRGWRGSDLCDSAVGKIAIWPAEVEAAAGYDHSFHRNRVVPAGQGDSLRRIVLSQVGRDCFAGAHCVELVDRCYKDVAVRLSLSALQIGREKINPELTWRISEAVSAEIVLPREAMGLGDVKFMAAIGAFIGWQGAIFSLMVSSMIGAAVGNPVDTFAPPRMVVADALRSLHRGGGGASGFLAARNFSTRCLRCKFMAAHDNHRQQHQRRTVLVYCNRPWLQRVYSIFKNRIYVEMVRCNHFIRYFNIRDLFNCL